MISARLLINGLVILDIILLLVSIVQGSFIAVACYSLMSMGTIPLGFLFVQCLGLVSLILFSRIWDRIFYKSSMNNQFLSLYGVAFSAFLNSLIFTFIGNVLVDNMFQFKEGNYSLVIMPFFITFGYYLACCLLGLCHKKLRTLLK